MDVSTCLKSLLLAIRQYRNNKSALNASQLQKNIEVSENIFFNAVIIIIIIIFF